MVLAHNVHDDRRTTDIQISQDITFDNMLLTDRTLAGLKESGFFKPSPIQLHAIPLGMCGFDLLLEAKSGTGKTAVFSIISLEKLDFNKGLQVIILAPTREIASQICDVVRQIGCKYDGLCVEVVMGGLPIQDDINKFKTNQVQIVVGSPGRLKHLIHDKHIDTNSVRLLVLDEADKLMEKGFIADIRFIHLCLTSQKQVILSSATYPEYTKELINQFVYEAQHICPNSDCVLLGVVQKVTFVKYNNNIVKQTENRFKELLKILTKKEFKQCLVFCNYQARVGELHKMLTKEKWPAEQLYGKQEQMDRLDALKTLQEYKCRLLISTDLAARGIDASNVDLVINFEPPFEWQTYLHRIGRAGRYGSYGMAVTILSEGIEQKKFFNLLQPLKLSCNLSPLWKEDSEHYNIIDEENIKTEVITKSLLLSEINGYKNFWDSLCGNNNLKENSNNRFENFDVLCKSFNELEEINKVQSFSNLVTSFNNINNNSFENDTSICKYKNVNLPDLLTKSYLNNIKCMKENLLYDQKYNCEKDQKILKDIKNDNISNKQILIQLGQINNCTDPKNLTNNPIDDTNESIELLNLGLPVAFSSSKDKPCERKVKTGVFFQNNVTSTTKLISERLSNISENVRTAKSVSELSLHSDNKKSNYSRITAKTRNFKNCYNVEDSRSPFDKSTVHQKNNLKYAKNSYENWYSQLKLQMKQIEIAVYIDEIGKL